MSLYAAQAHAEGFFEALFGSFDRPERSFSRSDIRPERAPTAITVTPRRTSAGSIGGGPSFCVRLCDGRYFPMQRNAIARPAQLCGSLCPASETRVFAGTDISRAVAADGSHYADLKNAFAYRKQTVANCTCNGRTSYGLVTLDAHDDPTLRAGDLVVTASGIVRAIPAERKVTPIADDVETTASLPSGLRGAAQ
jgi:hypothetical protein